MIRRTQNLIASSLASFALAGSAVALAPPDAAAQARPAQPAAGYTLSIPVQTPEGNSLRLTYVPGNGWRALDDGSQPQPLRNTVAGAEGPSGPDAAASADAPLSVFVDGPTGYVFVWTGAEPRWTYVGQVDGQGR